MSMEDAFNKWMDDYIKHPEEFALTWQTVIAHEKEKADGKTQSYGAVCAALLNKYMAS